MTASGQGLTRQFQAGALFGLGMGVMWSCALSEGGNPNRDWLALVPVFLFGLGFMIAGVVMAMRDERKATPPDPFGTETGTQLVLTAATAPWSPGPK